MLTDQIQFGIFDSTFKVYRAIAIYDEMCRWWDNLLRVQALNRR